MIGADLKGESAGFAYRAIQAATKNNSHLVLANQRVTAMNKFSNTFLQYKPGSEAWFVAGLCKAVLAEKLEKTGFINSDTKGFDELKKSLDSISFQKISEESGISEAALREAARFGTNGENVAIIYGAELIRCADMDNAVKGIINLGLLTGAVGEKGAGIYPLDEKNNTQGMLDMGVCPEYLPGYRTYDHAAADFGAAWNCTVPAKPGKNIFQIIDAIENGEIKALYIAGSDLVHILPDRNRVIKALQKLELLVVQDLFLTETARLAHVVLPAATAAEKSGSFTSIDNRVQCFTNAVGPAGQCRTDADIITKLHNLVAPVATITGQSAEELHKEITALSKLYTETCDHDGCNMGRVKNRISFSSKPAMFAAVAPVSQPAVSTVYPYMLATGPVLRHNGTFSTWSDNNMTVAPETYLEIFGSDAANAGIANGDSVKVSSANGSIILKAKLSDAVQPGLLFVPSHFRDTHTNLLTKNTAGAEAVKIERA